MGWRSVADKLDGLATVKHAVITVNGTWGAGLVQYPGQVVNGLAQFIDPDLCYEVVNPYPADFGPIGAGVSAPSYQQSVQDGVDWIAQWLQANPQQTFALIGYSQGAEVTSRVAIELMGGSLVQYVQNFIGGITFGNPCRGAGFVAPGVADPGGWGISPTRMQQLPMIDGEIVWADYVHSPANGDPGLDIYASVPVGQVGAIMTDAYGLATEMQLNDPGAFLHGMVSGMLKLVEDSGVIRGFMGGIPGLLGMGAEALIAFLVGLVTGPQANATGIAADVQAALAGLRFLSSGTAPHISYGGEIGGYQNMVAKAIGFLYQIATLTPAQAAA